MSTIDDTIARLEDQVKRACDKIDRLETKLTEAAAFLDGLAECLDLRKAAYASWQDLEYVPAECRAVAAKLRGET